MLSFIEALHTSNVLFSYYGFIDNEVLNEILKITKNRLALNNESVAVTKRLYNAINECVENIIKHNFFPGESLLKYKSLLLISQHENSYTVDTVNVISIEQKNAINSQLENLKSKSKDELKSMRASIISNNQYSQAATAGLGLVDMVLRTDSCEYRFKDQNPYFLFNINFKINSTLNDANSPY